MDKGKIYILIEKYFEGTSSSEEERQLRNILPSLPPGDKKIDEAIAVMGYAANIKSDSMVVRKISNRRKSGKWVIAAATTACLIAVGSISSYFYTQQSSRLIAYVGGERVDNRLQIEQLIISQLNDMSEANMEFTNQIESDFTDLRNAFDDAQ